MMEEQDQYELENEYLNQIFRGTISILQRIMELRALGLDEDEAKSLAYRATRLRVYP
jgi:CHASE3 domain sensor protein